MCHADVPVNIVEELSAMVSVLQMPGGRISFNEAGATLMNSMT